MAEKKQAKKVLTEKELGKIKEGLKAGTSYKQIGADVGVASLTVFRYAKQWGMLRGKGGKGSKAAPAKRGRPAGSKNKPSAKPGRKKTNGGVALANTVQVSSRDALYASWLQAGINHGFVTTQD